MIGKRVVLLLALTSILTLAACNVARPGGEAAAGQAAPVPTVALPPTATPPAQTVAQPQAQVTSVPLGSVNGRSYIAEVRVKDQVSLVPKVSGRLKELRVQVGDKVKAGDVIAVFDDSSQQAGLAQAQAQLGTAQAQLATAQAQLGAAQANLANVQAPARPVDLAQAQAAVKVAQAGLDRLQAGATAEDKEQARLRVEQARNQLLSVQGQRDAACGKDLPKPMREAQVGQCEALQGQTQAAEAAVDIAQQAYQRIQSGATEYDLAQAQAAVEQAQTGVNRVAAGATSQQIAAAQAQVDVAQAQVNVAQAAVKAAEAGVATAQLGVDETVVKAPFDGIVTARSAAPGAIVGSGNTSVATLIATANEVTFDVEAPLVGQVEIGAPVEITVSTYPGTTFKGKVVRISPTADTATRTFRVTAEPDDPKSQLKPGMFANLVIGGN